MDVSAPEDPVPLGSPPDLEDLYDEHVVARIDGGTGRSPYGARPVGAGHEDRDAPDGPHDDEPVAGIDTDAPPEPVIPQYPVARRLRIGGAMLAGAMFGVGDVLEPERARHHIIDYAPERLDENDQLVTFHMVAGDPRASRLVIRPWLLDRFRSRRA
jgi:hypothetical protein